MVNLDLCGTKNIGTTNTWHFHNLLYGITDTCAMKGTCFVVNISYHHEYLTIFTSIGITQIK
jgi:hypothetical protein